MPGTVERRFRWRRGGVIGANQFTQRRLDIVLDVDTLDEDRLLAEGDCGKNQDCQAAPYGC